MKLVLLLALSFLVGCGSVPLDLNPNGAKVVLVDYLKPAEREKLKEIDQVKCRLGENARSKDANIEGCRNDLRNKAADLGGDTVLVQNMDGSKYESDNPFLDKGYCKNCIEMKGIVYKSK